MNTIEAPASLGDIEIGRRADRGWWWTVVIDVGEMPHATAVGGQARTMLGALFAAWRYAPKGKR